MAEIVEFPSEVVRDWARFERSLRAAIADNLTPEQAEFVVAEMRPRWEALAVSIRYSATVPEECARHLQAQARMYDGKIEELIAKALNEVTALLVLWVQASAASDAR